jgi:hypothetical protein
MHDYDRRRLAAAETTETVTNIHWMYVEHEKIAQRALIDHQARLGKIETKTLIRENVIRLTGTTTDGRTFRIETTFFVKEMIVQSETRTIVEGTVSMGPVPDVLPRVEASVSKLLQGLTSLGLEKRDYFNFAKGWAHIAHDIEAWRRGDVVNTKGLRSSLSYLVKETKNLTDKLRSTFPAGELPKEQRQLIDLLEEASKALGAAARGIPDIG